MIERLLIKQFAIIDQLEIDFKPPFTVLTGETGAGKSIIIEAVSILLGGRSSADMIRHGAERAYVEGVFRFAPSHPVYEELSTGGWAEAGEPSFVLSRELNTNGRNPCRINGCTVSLQVYRQFAGSLLDIHGQHEYQQLMQAQKQLDILDAFGGDSLRLLRQEVGEDYIRWKELEGKLTSARDDAQAFAVKKDFLAYQLQEIDDAALRPGEEEELETEIHRLSNSQRIRTGIEQAYSALFQYEEGESAYDLLSKALRQLKELVRYDPSMESIFEGLEPASFILDETAREIDRYKDQMVFSPGRLEDAENRLYRIKSLGKKYGDNVETILMHRDSVANELAEMEEFSQKEEEWEGEVAKARESYGNHATELARLRDGVKKQLEPQVDMEFADLAMKAAHLKVEIAETPPGAKGLDGVEFLISTNTGEPFLPLARIASGGELSRITLAMKRILAASDTVETLVFDEIDSGIGGTTIQAVAEKLASISARQQVICVTHSPMIAAAAGQHILLEKVEQEGRTYSGVRELDEEGRVDELMRMLGGDTGSQDLRRHAQSMLSREG